MATKKTAKKTSTPAKTASSAKKASSAKRTAKKGTETSPRSMPKEGRDPQGGLTAKGREYFNKKEGSHLRPGVQGPADTPEKIVRKGSFLRRHFAHPRGPMKNDKGEPTRLALSAHAWGEPVPNTPSDAKKLASKGHELLEHYHEIKDGQTAGAKRASSKSAAKPLAKKRAAKKTAAKQATTTAVVPRKQASRKASVARKGAKGR